MSAGPEARRERVAFCAALLLALAACVALARIVVRTDRGMDADEAVHAVEALRLYERLEEGDVGGFLRDTWFPERWQPPVNPHLRWYPFVHAWSLLPGFALFGLSDESARLPSVLFLLGTCLCFFELGRRLAPSSRALCGFLAAALLLASPNVLAFSAQCLIEPAALFFSFLALLAYVWSLERGHPRGRALLAGAALGVAMLTKYDHGGMLALCLGVAELIRWRGRADRMLRSGAAVLFLLPLAMIAVWFAHPDKLDALKDSVSHPFAGGERRVLLDFFLTWITEYGSSVAMGALAVLALVPAWRLRSPAVRATCIWALATALFLGLRARFHFRYNFVEAPIFLLLAALVLPGAVRVLSDRLAARGSTAARACIALVGATVFAAGLATALAPRGAFELLRGPFAAFYDLRSDHWGLRLEPSAYVDHFETHYTALAVYLGGSFAALGLAVALLGAGGLALRAAPTPHARAPALVWSALCVALAPGIVRLYADLCAMVEWDLECHPELNDLQAFVIGASPPPATILLGGGWDQLTNNGLSWYRVTRAQGPRPRYADVAVVGDMIGSLVFPPEPRIRYWAQLLAEGGADELPERVVLIDIDPERFLYRTRIGPEVAIYREILAARGGYRSLASRSFATLGCSVEVLARAGEPGPPLSGTDAILARHGIGPDTAGAPRGFVGERGWSMRDDSLRHFDRH